MGSIHEDNIDGVRIRTELEAEDTLAVRLKNIHAEGPLPQTPVRPVLEKQTHAVIEAMDGITHARGGLKVIEVDGVANAVQMRTKPPEAKEDGFVEVVLKNGNQIDVDVRGPAVHVSREDYEKLTGTLAGLLK